MQLQQTKECFAKLGVTYQEFSDLSGVPTSTLEDFFSGRHQPLHKTWKRIKKTFDHLALKHNLQFNGKNNHG